MEKTKIIGIHKCTITENNDGTKTVKGKLIEPFKSIFEKRQELREKRIERNKKMREELSKPLWKFW